MGNLDTKFETSKKLSEKISESLPFVISSLQKTKFQYTGKALVSFIPKSGYLLNSILLSCNNSDIYSSSILFRSLIEHNFKHLYIFVRALNEDSDDVGKEYYCSLKGFEDLKSVQKILNYNKLTFPEQTQCNTKSESNKNLSEIGKKFDIDKIFQYLINNNNHNNQIFEKYKKEYLLERLTEYTNMSSSVHGGPFGELALLKIKKDENKFKKTLNKFVEDSLMLHKSMVEATYLFSSLMDNETDKIYQEIRNLK